MAGAFDPLPDPLSLDMPAVAPPAAPLAPPPRPAWKDAILASLDNAPVTSPMSQPPALTDTLAPVGKAPAAPFAPPPQPAPAGGSWRQFIIPALDGGLSKPAPPAPEAAPALDNPYVFRPGETPEQYAQRRADFHSNEGFIGGVKELGRGIARAAYQTPQYASEAASGLGQYVGITPQASASELAQAQAKREADAAEMPEWMKESATSRAEQHPWGSVAQAGESLTQSQGPAAAGAAIGAGLGLLGGPFAELTVPAGAGLGFLAGSALGILGAAGQQANASYEKIKASKLKEGVSDQQAEHDAHMGGLAAGAIEGGGELLGDYLFLRMGRFVPPVVKTGIGNTVRKSLGMAAGDTAHIAEAASNKGAWWLAAKELAKTSASEVATEMGQQVGEQDVEAAYGASPWATFAEAKQVVVPTLIMTGFMAAGMQPFGAMNRAAINHALANPGDPNTRAQAAAQVEATVRHEDPALADIWRRYAVKAIADNTPMVVDHDAWYQGLAAGTATAPAGTPNAGTKIAGPGVLPAPDSRGRLQRGADWLSGQSRELRAQNFAQLLASISGEQDANAQRLGYQPGETDVPGVPGTPPSAGPTPGAPVTPPVVVPGAPLTTAANVAHATGATAAHAQGAAGPGFAPAQTVTPSVTPTEPAAPPAAVQPPVGADLAPVTPTSTGESNGKGQVPPAPQDRPAASPDEGKNSSADGLQKGRETLLNQPGAIQPPGAQDATTLGQENLTEPTATSAGAPPSPGTPAPGGNPMGPRLGANGREIPGATPVAGVRADGAQRQPNQGTNPGSEITNATGQTPNAVPGDTAGTNPTAPADVGAPLGETISPSRPAAPGENPPGSYVAVSQPSGDAESGLGPTAADGAVSAPAGVSSGAQVPTGAGGLSDAKTPTPRADRVEGESYRTPHNMIPAVKAQEKRELSKQEKGAFKGTLVNRSHQTEGHLVEVSPGRYRVLGLGRGPDPKAPSMVDWESRNTLGDGDLVYLETDPMGSRLFTLSDDALRSNAESIKAERQAEKRQKAARSKAPTATSAAGVAGATTTPIVAARQDKGAEPPTTESSSEPVVQTAASPAGDQAAGAAPVAPGLIQVRDSDGATHYIKADRYSDAQTDLHPSVDPSTGEPLTGKRERMLVRSEIVEADGKPVGATAAPAPVTTTLAPIADVHESIPVEAQHAIVARLTGPVPRRNRDARAAIAKYLPNTLENKAAIDQSAKALVKASRATVAAKPAVAAEPATQPTAKQNRDANRAARKAAAPAETPPAAPVVQESVTDEAGDPSLAPPAAPASQLVGAVRAVYGKPELVNTDGIEHATLAEDEGFAELVGHPSAQNIARAFPLSPLGRALGGEQMRQTADVVDSGAKGPPRGAVSLSVEKRDGKYFVLITRVQPRNENGVNRYFAHAATVAIPLSEWVDSAPEILEAIPDLTYAPPVARVQPADRLVAPDLPLSLPDVPNTSRGLDREGQFWHRLAVQAQAMTAAQLRDYPATAFGFRDRVDGVPVQETWKYSASQSAAAPAAETADEPATPVETKAPASEHAPKPADPTTEAKPAPKPDDTAKAAKDAPPKPDLPPNWSDVAAAVADEARAGQADIGPAQTVDLDRAKAIAQSVVDDWSDRLGIKQKIEVASDPAGTKSSMATAGKTWRLAMPSNLLRALESNNAATRAQAVETLFHELSHAVDHAVFNKLSAPEKAWLKQAYAIWVDDNANESVEQIVRSSGTPVRAAVGVQKVGNRSGFGSLTREEALNEGDWIADNIARALLGRELQAPTPDSRSLFYRMADQVRELYRRLLGPYLPSLQAADRTVDALIARRLADVEALRAAKDQAKVERSRKAKEAWRIPVPSTQRLTTSWRLSPNLGGCRAQKARRKDSTTTLTDTQGWRGACSSKMV